MEDSLIYRSTIYGGSGGGYFDDSMEFEDIAAARSKPTKIIVGYSGNAYNGSANFIQLQLNTGYLPLHGLASDNSKQNELIFKKDEYISSVHITTGSYPGSSEVVYSIKVTTSKGRTLETGKRGCIGSYTFKPPLGYEILGFIGRSGWQIDALGIVAVSSKLAAAGRKLSSGLIAYYPLKNDLADYSGRQLNLSQIPDKGELSWVDGKFGKAVSFAKGGAFLEIPFVGERNCTDFTISCWVKIYDYPQTNTEVPIVGRMFLRPDGSLKFELWYDTPVKYSNVMNVLIPASIGKSEWHNIVLTWCGAQCKLLMYVDQEKVKEQVLSLPAGFKILLPAFFTIGGYQPQYNAPYLFLNGDVGDVLFSKTYADSKIVQLLNDSEEMKQDFLRIKHCEAIPLVVALPLIAIAGIISLVSQIALANKVLSEEKNSATPTVAEVAAKVRKEVGSPAQPGRQVGRSDIGIDGNYPIHLDVGGEGPIDLNGIETGFQAAININDTRTCTVCTVKDQPIPNLVLVQSWSTNPGYPFKDDFADYITIMNAPLTNKGVEEMARVVRPDGKIGLWIDQERFKEQISNLATKLDTTPIYNARDDFHGKAGFTKILIIANKYDEL